MMEEENVESIKMENKELCNIKSLVSEIREDSSDLEGSIDFTLTKKKKKKKTTILLESKMPAENDDHEVQCQLETLMSFEKYLGDAIMKEYSYDFLLTRVFNLMREKNPNLDEDLKKKLVMKPPQVLRVGTKKTSFANFLEICKLLHRTPQHIQSFLLTELGTTGSVDGNNQLVIKGKFQQKQIESVLRRYIREYVTCHTCHSPATLLQRDTRLCFLQCEACGSRCSVASIKSGFQAVINKRAAMRAKAV